MPPPPNHEEVLLGLALEQPAAGRAAFLDAVCAGDPALHQRLQARLSAHVAEDNLRHQETGARPTIKLNLPDAPDEPVGETLGSYKLMERLGEGGCGVVYVAEQTQPVRRRVALKVIKLGMDTKAVVARFEAERQALAMMDHPNIAKVLDAGTTDAGRPYFVMELVRGIRITDYCDQNQLSTPARLELFIKVCQAIQHAHQKGIIHRDIKPSNILVTLHDGVPVPKVIDFGIAKATEGRQLTDATVYTQLHQFIGTPAYMSPEQAEMSGLDIDTRSDIYSLGVSLYELLAGSTPFDAEKLMSQGVDQMRQILREQEPVRPSTRLATLADADLTTTAKRRSIDKSKLVHQLQGDLDWIVMKCLEKDRTRRYESASGLAADLRRHLNNEPIVARPPGSVYRFQKMVRRHRFAFAAAAAIAAALVLGLVVSLSQAIRATHAQQAAQAAQAREARQRELAESSEKQAVAAQTGEARLREQAQAQELAARRRAYAADMLLCQQALAANNFRRARLLLDRQRPATGTADLRGWEWRYLWQRCQGEALVKISTGKMPAVAARFTGDANQIAAFQGRSRVSLWNLATHQENVLQPENRSDAFVLNAGRMTLSADGEWLVAAGRNGAAESVVRIWDAHQGTKLSEWAVGTNLINALALAPDKQRLAVFLGDDQSVSVWNVATKQKEFQVFAPEMKPGWKPWGAVAFAPDGSSLAIGDDSGQVRLVAARNGSQQALLPGTFLVSTRGGGVTTLAYSPDGRFLAAGGAFVDPRILVWDAATGQPVATLAGHRGFITDLAFSPDGRRLASTSADQTIKLWNTDAWNEAGTLLGHNNIVWSAAFSPDGRQLATTDINGLICIWPVSGKLPDRGSLLLPAGIQSADVSPDGQSLVGISDRGTVRLLTAATLQDQSVPPEAGTNNVDACWVAPDEILLLSRPLQLKTWRLSSQTITTNPPDVVDSQDAGLVFFPSDHLFAVVRPGPPGTSTLNLWDASAHRMITSRTFNQPPKTVLNLFLSKDGERVALINVNQLSVWNLKNRAEKPIVETGFENIMSVALFSRHPWVVIASAVAPTADVWDLATGTKLVSLEGFNQALLQSVVSPDEARLVTSTIGQEPIRFWDVESWNEVLNLPGRPGCLLNKPHFLSDANTLAATEVDFASGLQQVRLWRAPAWAEINAAESNDPAERK